MTDFHGEFSLKALAKFKKCAQIGKSVTTFTYTPMPFKFFDIMHPVLFLHAASSLFSSV